MTEKHLELDRNSYEPDIGIEEIMALIPHRYPFLLVDKVKEVKLGESAVGIKNVTMNEPYFQGHFPGHPIMSGVLIIEALAQTGGILALKSVNKADKNVFYFMSIEEAKFRKPVVPGDTIRLKVNFLQGRSTVWKFKGEAWVNEKLVTEAKFSAMVIK